MDIKEASLTDFVAQDRHPWELARCRVVKSLVSSVLSRINKGKRRITILDIGCGDIFIAETLLKQYCNVDYYAVDNAFSDELIRLYGNKAKSEGLSLSLYNSLEEAQSVISSEIDVILLLDVIEHIENDAAFLRQCIALNNVSSNTHFIITVPAYQGLFCNHDRFLGHYRRYSCGSLKDMADSIGLNTLSRGYFFTSLLIPRFLQKMLSRDKELNSVKGVGGWKRRRIIDSIVVGILTIDYRFFSLLRKIGIQTPGLSVFSIFSVNK